MSKLIAPVAFILSLMFILLLQGAIPFLSIPTLGQALWTTGFSQSLANQSIFDLHAINFGIPKPAAIAFGLAGAYPASLFIRAGLHPADAYALMTALWLSVAFWGAWSISRAFKLSLPLAALASILWMSMPIIWGHAHYSMLMLGISLLAFYFYYSLRLFYWRSDNQNLSIRFLGLYFLVPSLAIFMDGYSFMMFALGSSIFAAYIFLSFPERRKALLSISFPVHICSFALAYVLFTTYIGKAQFDATHLNFFRGWGVDLLFLAIPSQGVHWLWDVLGLSSLRAGREQFGDASVWTTTFALPVIIAGLTAWWQVRKDYKLATGFLLIALFGFYMGLGPSLKINSVKPEYVNTQLMTENFAVAPTGNAWLSEFVPGFKNMRASYRWTALGFLGFWLLIVLLLAQKQTSRYRGFVSSAIILLIISNLPDISNKLTNNLNYRDNFFEIEKTLIKDLKNDLDPTEQVAFLPYRNDFFVNYIASRINIRAYNIGGDKNLDEAKKHWPKTMSQFKMANLDNSFILRVALMLARGEADAIILPYIDLLWAAHSWPAPLKFKKEMLPIVSELRRSQFIELDEREYYSVVRLAQNFDSPEKLQQLDTMLSQSYCVSPDCLQYSGEKNMRHQVGQHIGLGMQTDGRTGYLMYGPYLAMKAGEYILQLTGKASSNTGNVLVDVFYHKAGKTYASFKGLRGQPMLPANVLLREKVTLDEDVPELEVRVFVDNISNLLIDGYSLKPIHTGKK